MYSRKISKIACYNRFSFMSSNGNNEPLDNVQCATYWQPLVNRFANSVILRTRQSRLCSSETEKDGLGKKIEF